MEKNAKLAGMEGEEDKDTGFDAGGIFGKSEKRDTEDYYYTPEGYKVFTEKYLLKRGHCCQSGCRHCPYGYDPKQGRIVRP